MRRYQYFLLMESYYGNLQENVLGDVIRAVGSRVGGESGAKLAKMVGKLESPGKASAALRASGKTPIGRLKINITRKGRSHKIKTGKMGQGVFLGTGRIKRLKKDIKPGEALGKRVEHAKETAKDTAQRISDKIPNLKRIAGTIGKGAIGASVGYLGIKGGLKLLRARRAMQARNSAVKRHMASIMSSIPVGDKLRMLGKAGLIVGKRYAGAAVEAIKRNKKKAAIAGGIGAAGVAGGFYLRHRRKKK